jgi:outer membrane protein OmpA-like peptidoglycan-associated protein
MKHFKKTILSIFFICYSVSTFAQPYRVQLAAYVEKVPFSYFSEAHIFGVYMLTDQNNIYRYYIGEFRERAEADLLVKEARKQGFANAYVIDIEEQRQLCGKPCPYISPSSTYSDESTEILNLQNVFFGFNQSILTMESKRALDKVATVLKANSHLKVLVSGHTDSKGSAEYNISLSKRRARNSRNYLINRGIKSSRIKAEVFGESIPEKENMDSSGKDDPEGRKFNRRVVLAIYDPNNGQIPFDRTE